MSKRLSLDIVKKKFEEKEYELISLEYKDTKTPLEYKCPKHPDIIQKITYDTLRRSGCRLCGIENSSNLKRRSLESVEKSFKDKGYKLISTTYNRALDKLEYICSKHPESIQTISLANLEQGHGCKYCGTEISKHKRFVDFDKIIEDFSNKDYILINQRNEYKNNKQPLEYICKKHNNVVQKICYNSLSNGRGCFYCGRETASSKIRKDFKDVQKIFKNKGYNLLSKECDYKNSNTPLLYICPFHPDEIRYITYMSISQGQGCRLCGLEMSASKKRLTMDEIENRLKDRRIVFIDNYDEYNNNSEKHNFTCEFHPDINFQTTLNAVFNMGVGCPFCSEPKGEKRIREYLESINIDFIPQKKFDNLYRFKPQYKLSYDFYIPSKNLLIEYQGEYHDGKVNRNSPDFQTDEMYVDQQQRDTLKREYAEDNNINLLEIWYWDFDRIEEILEKELIK